MVIEQKAIVGFAISFVPRPGFPVTGIIRVCGFLKESRMKIVNAAKLDRKSGTLGERGHPSGSVVGQILL